MLNFKKTVFTKLYRYYCAKLLTRIWLALFYFLLFLFLIIIQGISLRKTLDQKIIEGGNNWQWKLVIFWVISFAQLVVMQAMMTPLISWLVGRGLGWEELKNKQLFRIPKISRQEDIKVLIFTPGVDRQTVIWAKFAATFTYFMAFNLFLTLPFFIYFCFFTNFGIIAALCFLLLNGVGFGLINFILTVPFLFYQQEGGSFLVYFLCFIFIILLLLSGYLLSNFILQYPIVFCLLSVPFSILAGYLFFTLYWNKYLKNDLD
jgi:hypothetical protein